MKVYINRKPKSGPWGGGNKTVCILSNMLKERSHDVVFDLDDSVDVIFCMDPRPNDTGIWYKDMLDHKNRFGSKIIQRVGDIGTHSKPDLTNLVFQTFQFSDFFIFPSDWARRSMSFSGSNYAIVKNHSRKVFHRFKSESVLGVDEKMKIVTHHWSTNDKKGFHFYKFLAEYSIENNIQFTFIGRIPDNFDTSLINYIEPQDDESLSRLLPQNHVYLTASIEEAGANHVVEAVACGLPIVYHDLGGSIPEYVSEYGVSFNDHNSLLSSIDSMRDRFNIFKSRALGYNECQEDVIEVYGSIIENA